MVTEHDKENITYFVNNRSDEEIVNIILLLMDDNKNTIEIKQFLNMTRILSLKRKL
jgi:hypothetical protein